MTPEQFFLNIRQFQKNRETEVLLDGLRWLFSTPLTIYLEDFHTGGTLTTSVLSQLFFDEEDFDQISSSADQLFSSGRPNDAALLYSLHLLTVYRDSAHLWALLGICQIAQQKFQDGLDSFQKAASLSPKDPVYQKGLAECLWGDGKTHEAKGPAFKALFHSQRKDIFSSQVKDFLVNIVSSSDQVLSQHNKSDMLPPN